jgi:hypothetical protein
MDIFDPHTTRDPATYVIIGPRQSGKTTILKYLIHLLRSRWSSIIGYQQLDWICESLPNWAPSLQRDGYVKDFNGYKETFLDMWKNKTIFVTTQSHLYIKPWPIVDYVIISCHTLINRVVDALKLWIPPTVVASSLCDTFDWLVVDTKAQRMMKFSPSVVMAEKIHKLCDVQYCGNEEPMESLLEYFTRDISNLIFQFLHLSHHACCA